MCMPTQECGVALYMLVLIYTRVPGKTLLLRYVLFFLFFFVPPRVDHRRTAVRGGIAFVFHGSRVV